MSPIDLTALADLKAWLGVASTGDDALLAGLVTETSMAILADLGRAAIQPTLFTETRDGAGERSILLRHWPVGQVLALTVNGLPVTIGPISSGTQPFVAVLDPADAAPPGWMQRLSLRDGVFPHGVQNIQVTYRAGYEIGGEAAIVPAVAPFAVTAAAPYGAWCADGAVAYANGAPLRAALVPAPGVYAVLGGTYTFSPSDAGAAVVLRYGYTPADLARCCREWAAERYAYRARIGQSSKSLGGQETTAFIVKAMPDFVAHLLQPYRRVVGP